MKSSYTSLPAGYPVCELADCPMAATCLHHIVYHPTLKTEDYLRLINPDRCSKDEHCHFYRDNTPVTYARGFTGFQKQMFPDQYRRFMAICVDHWSRNPYFERRRGARLLPPDEQKFILDALKKAGVNADLRFDSYECEF